MNMIVDAAHLQGGHPVFAGNAADVFPNSLFNVGSQTWFTILG